MEIQQDWNEAKRDGRVSWMHAFDDLKSFGPAKAHGKRYRTVLHQMKEPLSSITSMCTEPVLSGEKAFLQRHIPLPSSYEKKELYSKISSRACLEFWVEWHTFITAMRFPTYKVLEVELRDIFDISGLGHLYLSEGRNITTNSNHRRHRKKFSWQEIFTMDPTYALRAWQLAHYYGYDYPGIDFSNITCLNEMPSCRKPIRQPSNKCVPGSGPSSALLQEANQTITAPSANLGFTGWSDSGCVEVKLNNGTYIGIRGLVSKQEFDLIKNDLDPMVIEKINSTILERRGNTVSSNNSGSLHNMGSAKSGIGMSVKNAIIGKEDNSILYLLSFYQASSLALLVLTIVCYVCVKKKKKEKGKKKEIESKLKMQKNHTILRV